MKVLWTRTAKGHLRSIHNYIASDSPRHAKRVVDQIIRRADQLKVHPRLGPLVREYQDESIRELLYRSYRIIYRILEDRIDVLAVIHGATLLPRDPP